MSEMLRGLVIDNWYKVLLVFSAVVFALALTVPLQVPNKVVLLVSLGGLVYAFGQWINHPHRETIGPGYKIVSHARFVSASGVLLELAGAGFAALGTWKLFVA